VKKIIAQSWGLGLCRKLTAILCHAENACSRLRSKKSYSGYRTYRNHLESNGH